MVMADDENSIFALQLAKVLGARVIATTSSEAKAEKLLAPGADEIINYKDIPDGVNACVRLPEAAASTA